MRSVPVTVGDPERVYGPLVTDALRFFAAQTDGARRWTVALSRAPAHLHDTTARVYAAPRFRAGRILLPLRAVGGTTDASGGWFDAGDYLKFVETTSFADTMLLYAARQPGAWAAAIAATARTGTDWLLRMWDPVHGTLGFQVGIGDGLGDRLTGDHDLWRLPQTDRRPAARPAGRHPVPGPPPAVPHGVTRASPQPGGAHGRRRPGGCAPRCSPPPPIPRMPPPACTPAGRCTPR
ncbi:MAG: glycoside hydrolase family 9 protein [Thermoleophilia bacterium]